jgi:putative thymidine phosphorylase
MKLKIKKLKLSAGIPLAMLSPETSELLGVHPGERVLLYNPLNKKKTSSVVDIAQGIIRKEEVGISEELASFLKLGKLKEIEVILSPTPETLFLIKKKFLGKSLSKKEIKMIIEDIVSNNLSEAEIALFVSGMYQKGMNKKETIFLIKAILDTGKKLEIREKIIADKHSIGGISGNRTTPIVVAICVAAGLTMPKTSSRAITSPAGTADVIETLAKVDFSMGDLKRIVAKTGGCLVWGGGLGMVPADSKIIKIEKLLKVDPEAQLLASIMAKKFAAGSTHILIDIPYGKNAKVDKRKALDLSEKFKAIGKAFRKKVAVVLTKSDEPMGEGVGPSLEMRDVIRVLDPSKKGPSDLEAKSLLLAGRLLELTKKTKKGEGEKLAKEILYSGKAFSKFKEIIVAQGGKVSEPKLGKFKKEIFSKKNTKVLGISNTLINSLAKVAGCPLDKYAGIDIKIGLGQKLKKGELMMTLYAESKSRLNEALNFYKRNKPLSLK